MRSTYQTLLRRYGPDHMSKIGKKGGKKSRGGGFADIKLASRAGKKSKKKV